MNYGEIKDLFYDLSGFRRSGPYFSDANALMWANMAHRDLVSKSQCLERRQKIVVTAGTQTYDLPDDCNVVRRASYDGYKIMPMTKLELQWHENGWDRDQGTPCWYFVDGLNEQIGLYEIPNSSTSVEASSSGTGFKVSSTGTGFVIDTSDSGRLPPLTGFLIEEITGLDLEVYFSCRPPDIAADADVPALPLWAHHGLVYGMLRHAWRAHTPQRDVAKSALFGALYARVANRLKIRTNGKLPKDWLLEMRGYGERPNISRLPDIIEVS